MKALRKSAHKPQRHNIAILALTLAIGLVCSASHAQVTLLGVQYIDDNAVIYDHLGDIYFHQGRVDDAAGQWQKALDLDGENEEILKKLEEVREQE